MEMSGNPVMTCLMHTGSFGGNNCIRGCSIVRLSPLGPGLAVRWPRSVETTSQMRAEIEQLIVQVTTCGERTEEIKDENQQTADQTPKDPTIDWSFGTTPYRTSVVSFQILTIPSVTEVATGTGEDPDPCLLLGTISFIRNDEAAGFSDLRAPSVHLPAFHGREQRI
jgi:hypothetical protein